MRSILDRLLNAPLLSGADRIDAANEITRLQQEIVRLKAQRNADKGGAQNAGTRDAKQLPTTAEEDEAFDILEKKQ